ncbi:MAG: excinuclease ABC subunit UvrA, partial [Dehalococcoidales bacterium]
MQGLDDGSRIMVMSPLIKDRKGEYLSVFDDLRKAGYVRARVDGEIRDLSETIALDKKKKHTIEVVVDRLVIGQSGSQSRIADSVETALKLGAGVLLVLVVDGEELLFSEHFACVHCEISLGEFEPRTFSFNSPHGACPACAGLGVKREIDPDLVIPDRSISISRGAIRPYQTHFWYLHRLRNLDVPMDTPVEEFTKEQLDLVLYGERRGTVDHRNRFGRFRRQPRGFEGVIPRLERLYHDTTSDYSRASTERYMTTRECPECHGKRLKPESLAVTIGGDNIVDISSMSVARSLEWVVDLGGDGKDEVLSARERTIAHQILKEIRARLGFLGDIGLDYLTLDRPAATLSGGEAQRIRLATQIGSGLMGVLYICDEPTVGLHQADNHRLIETLKRLRDLGNTVLIVEHDETMMRTADHIIDMGIGAGEHGGRVVVTGTIDDVMACEESITGQYLSGARRIPLPATRREGSGEELLVKGARQNNLKNLDVSIPLGKLVCVTGVSGSGKSTLVDEILYRKLAQVINRSRRPAGDCDDVLGAEQIDKVVNIDQSPIGRTPRSNPATYTGTFTLIRELFAAVPEARM